MMGERKRVCVVGGPWMERIGCHGWTVPEMSTEFRERVGQVAVLLDSDPLDVASNPMCDDGDVWTCFISTDELVPLPTPVSVAPETDTDGAG